MVSTPPCPSPTQCSSYSPEFAAEIKEEYPEKKVTVVHGGAKLLTSAYPDKYREEVERKCRARGINFVFNERVDRYPERGTRGLTTRQGTYFESCDLAVGSISRFFLLVVHQQP